MDNSDVISKRGDVFCKGPLLHTVQMSKIFEDSKTFVDMKMRHPPQKILDKFENLMLKTLSSPTDQQVKQFVVDNFEKSEVEFANWHPKDWKENPGFLKNINNNEYREFACALHELWKDLGRKISKKAEEEIDCSSLIWVPNPIIVPGGRFREFYYWDTYWIIRGLLISEMFETTKGMLNNFLHIVDQYGYIPNGGRIYYLGRSQPPTLIPSFKVYMDVVNDLDYLRQSINLLEKEFDFWMTKRTKLIKLGDKEYTLATYGNCSQGPRPESYAEDVGSISTLEGDEAKSSFYSEIKAACESGMDFTSRWFVSNGTNKGSLRNIKTTSIIPVDLNAILYSNAVTLYEFNKQLQNFERADYYRGISERWLEAVEAVLWHEDVGVWLDFDLENGVRRDYFYASNLTPLWAGCYSRDADSKVVEMALNYLHRNDILNYPGGVPQSLEPTGEQWDFPNAWPPSQHILIFGLRRTQNPRAQTMAEELAKKWLNTNYQAYLKTHHMAEKYDASLVGHSGGGGEYRVQFGFGWTNGVVLDILVNFFSDM
ncbi:trehalase-like [Coccinella septempunctata]|uniref:trehalase-like n=1 Tax=Coccinella septempunctata TaxID=41139 RepID=UPI001D060F85|nr:trehalase-like [Coccinella septempunctata]